MGSVGKVRHVVMFKFKDELNKDKVNYLENKFRSLQNHIPVIKDFEWGTDESTEGVSQGFTHFFMVTFGNLKDRDTYLSHPAHIEYSDEITQLRDKVLVFDFISQN